MTLDFIVLTLSLIFLRLPLLFGDNPSRLLMMISLIPFWFVIFKKIITSGKTKILYSSVNKSYLKILTIFVLLMLFALLRAYDNNFFSLERFLYEVFQLLTILSFGLTVFLKPSNENEKSRMRMAIIYAVAIYVCLNVLLHLVGIRPSVHRLAGLTGSDHLVLQAKVLSLFGIKAYRTLFPMTDGINSFGTIAGASLAAGIAMFIFAKSKLLNKIIATLVIIASLYAVLMADIRGALIAILVTLILMYAIAKLKLDVIPYFSFMVPLLPLISIIILSNISKINIIATFSRSSDNLATFSGRTLFWNFGLSELSKFSLIHFVGFGIFGQASVGVSQNYSGFFLERQAIDPTTVSLHNASLQYIFDIGYFGLAIFIALLFVTLKQLLRRSKVETNGASSVTVAVILYFIFAGIFEAVPTIYSTEAFTMFIFIAISNLPKVFHLKHN